MSKAIDKAAGAEREVVGRYRPPNGAEWNLSQAEGGSEEHVPGSFTASGTRTLDQTAPATPEAAQWEGWGTALKPAHEPIVVARKPLVGTVAQNVLEHGTGALNIDGCRIGTDDLSAEYDRQDFAGMGYGGAAEEHEVQNPGKLGRWPANVALDPEAAAMLDEQSGEREVSGSAGGTSRFFYQAKASRAERTVGVGANAHPT